MLPYRSAGNFTNHSLSALFLPVHLCSLQWRHRRWRGLWTITACSRLRQTWERCHLMNPWTSCWNSRQERYWKSLLWSEAASTLKYIREIKKRPRPSTLILHENEAFETALQTGGIWKRWLFSFVFAENILTRELFKTDDVRVIMLFSWPRFPQTQIQNDRWLLLFLDSFGVFGRKTLDPFSGRRLRFEILPAH